ncbi:MAG: hypothetical protein HKN21_10725 [Candidatus Eisenbacteria bacterium]|uniref:Uncharacterized protein n=1 Tax=Eiseniibacteriota bacterium TaxID=2212470 RepID=A0A7Y2H308_UNCEI|nr:hypothetical protein [Candidatus Eisenbacteria bacterium]
MAERAQARKLWLYHHHPQRTDAQMDALLKEARESFPETDGAREGLVIRLN